MTRTASSFFLLFVALLGLASRAPAQGLDIDIVDGTEGTIPIAIVPFAWEAAAMPDQTQIDQVVRADLNRSGQFRALRREDVIELPVRGSDVRYPTWKMLKQRFLVIGRVLGAEGGAYKVEFELHDVINQRSELALALPVRPGEFRSVSHQIADLVYEKIMKVRGAFFTRIAYITAKRQGQARYEYAIWIADSDGYNPQRIVWNAEPFLSPAWSPDGRYLAYVSFERVGGHTIYMHELATGSRRLVSSFKGINGAPAFSPDGSKLALTLSKSGNPEIHTLDLASNSLTQLTRHFAIDTEAAWMPGGNSLLFTSDRSGKPQIYSLASVGGTPERITSVGEYNARVTPSYDGRLLAMVQGNRNVYRIAVVDRERGGAGAVRMISPGPLDESPSFAPNASMVLYAAREGNRGVLYAASVDGSVRQRLALADGDVREPAWGPFRQR
ncbi:MAG: Tol-Pal system beta propeller repeat protein TolB [Xanthomonadales bacterium]|nr:Tol-Pal system beta propeller repeat protein TolB [Xanthomonadales bacterium]